MASNGGSLIPLLSACLNNSMDKPVIAILFLLLTGGAGSAVAQGLSPSTPTQELIYFGGRLIAVEERGPGGNGNAMVMGGTAAPAGASTSATTAPAAATSSGVTPPPMPNLSIPPQDTSAGAGRPIATPASTHGVTLTQP